MFRFGLNRKRKTEHLTTYLHRPRTTRSPLSFWGDGGIVPFSLLEMGAGKKKDLRVSLNPFFSSHRVIVIPQILVMVRKKGKQRNHGLFCNISVQSLQQYLTYRMS